MSGRSAEVDDTQPILAFARVLAAWGDAAHERVHRADVEFDETRSWVRQRAVHWERQVDYYTGLVIELQRSLAMCLAQPEPAWCGEIEAQVAEASQFLQVAHDNLERANFWSTRLDRETTDWTAISSGLARALSADVPDATRLLNAKMAVIEEYDAASVSEDRSDPVEPLRTAPPRLGRRSRPPLPLPLPLPQTPTPLTSRPEG